MSTEKLYVYLDPEGARKCGHVGLIFLYSDGSAEKIYQSAVNPKESIFRLILLRQPVKVIVKKFKNYESMRKLAGKNKYFELKTGSKEEIREAVERYIRENRPYSSLTNNCGQFLHEVVSVAGDVKSKNKLIPREYYEYLKKNYRKNQKK